MTTRNVKIKGSLFHGMRKRSASFIHPSENDSLLRSADFQAYLRAVTMATGSCGHPPAPQSAVGSDVIREVDRPERRLRSFSDSAALLGACKRTPALKPIPETSTSNPHVHRPTAPTNSQPRYLTSDFTFFEDDSEEEGDEDIWSSVESFDSGDVEIYSNSPVLGRRHSCEKNVRFGPVQMRDPALLPGIQVFAWLPNGNRVTLTGQPSMRIKDLISDVTMEYKIPRHRLRRASTLGIIRDDIRISSIARQEIIIESVCKEETEEAADKRLAVLNEIISSERVYCNLLQSIFMTYKEPLRKSPSMPKSDHIRIFSSVKLMVTVSATFLTKLEAVADSWDAQTSTIGDLFDAEFLGEYQNYFGHFRVIRLLLVFLRNSNKDFVNLCREKRGTSWHTLDSLLLLPVQRISQYDKYLSEYYDHIPPTHPDYTNVCQATRNIRTMVTDREDEITNLENETKLQQVQDRFPHDDLQLIDKDTKSQRFKTLASRRRSAPSAALKTALIGGKKLSTGSGPSPADLQSLEAVSERHALNNNNNRVYIMEGPIQITAGVQAQNRYVFLFNDVLIIAKPNKSCTTFRVKHRIKVSELWLATCIDDVIEISKPQDRSFVVGWPTTNVVWTLSSAEEKEIWWQNLHKNIIAQREREEPKTLNLKILNRESQGTSSVLSRTIQVGNSETAEETLRTCLQQFHLDDASPEEYGLWVQSGKNSGTYPLIGHEIPYAIKMSHLHEALSKQSTGGEPFLSIEDDAMASMAIDELLLKQHKCQFFLRRRGNSHRGISVGDDTLGCPLQNKRQKKTRRPPFNITFRKSVSSKADSPDAFSPPPSPNSKLFGIPLPALCQDQQMPRPVLDLLTVIYHNGPYTTGIFRKSANARITRDLKGKLSAGEVVCFDEVPVTVAAALLKDFLRNIPNGVMYNVLYENWLNTSNVETEKERISAIQLILNDIPVSHRNLLRHLMCIMYHINQRSEENNMNAYNQAVCCSPSMLWAPSSSGSIAQVEATEKVPHIVQFMVENALEVFGEDILDLFTGPPMKRSENSRRDSSGDSDSFHGSLEPGGMKRDDSSLDSIDRELYSNETWPSTLPVLSPSTLSRDSGLMSSDNQLYPESDTTDTTDSGVDSKDRSGRSSSPSPAMSSMKHVRSSSSLEKGDGDYRDSALLQPEASQARRVSEPNSAMPEPRKRFVLTKSQSTVSSIDNSPEGSDDEVELSAETVQMIRELSEECSFKLFSGLLSDEESGPEGDGFKKVLDKRRQDFLNSQKHQLSESPSVSANSSSSSLTAGIDIMGRSSPSSPTEKSPPKQKQRRISMPAKFYNPLHVFHKKSTSSRRGFSISEVQPPDTSEQLVPIQSDSSGEQLSNQDSKPTAATQQRSRRPRLSTTRPPGKLSPDGHLRGSTYPEASIPPREFFPRDAIHLSLSQSVHRESKVPTTRASTMTRSFSDEQLKNASSSRDEELRKGPRTPSPASLPSDDTSRNVRPPSYQETMHRRARLQHQSVSLDKPDVPVFEKEESHPRVRRSGVQSCNISRSQPVCRLPSSPYTKSPPTSPKKTSPIIESGIIFHISDSESSDNEPVDIESLRQFSPNSGSLHKEVKQVRRTSSDRLARADGRTESFANAVANNNIQRTLSEKRTPHQSSTPQARLFYGQEASLSPRTQPTLTPRSGQGRPTPRSKGSISRSKSVDEHSLHQKTVRIDSVDSAISTSSEMSPSSSSRSVNFSFNPQSQSTAEQDGLSPKAKSTMQEYFLSSDPVNGMAACKETEKAVTKSRQDWRYLAAKRHSIGFLDELDNVEFTEESYV